MQIVCRGSCSRKHTSYDTVMVWFSLARVFNLGLYESCGVMTDEEGPHGESYKASVKASTEHFTSRDSSTISALDPKLGDAGPLIFQLVTVSIPRPPKYVE